MQRGMIMLVSLLLCRTFELLKIIAHHQHHSYDFERMPLVIGTISSSLFPTVNTSFIIQKKLPPTQSVKLGCNFLADPDYQPQSALQQLYISEQDSSLHNYDRYIIELKNNNEESDLKTLNSLSSDARLS